MLARLNEMYSMVESSSDKLEILKADGLVDGYNDEWLGYFGIIGYVAVKWCTIEFPVDGLRFSLRSEAAIDLELGRLRKLSPGCTEQPSDV